MEENEENTENLEEPQNNENAEQTEEETFKVGEDDVSGNPLLKAAEHYINSGETEKAQEFLDAVEEESGEKFFLQSRIYKQKSWFNEQRKALKAAIKADPDNEKYKAEMEELKAFSKTAEYKHIQRERQMCEIGDGCAEGCCTGICDGICYGICECLGSGC